MPLLKYFVTVGIALTVGLLAVSAYLEPSSQTAKVSVTPTTASLLHFGAPPAPPPKKTK